MDGFITFVLLRGVCGGMYASTHIHVRRCCWWWWCLIVLVKHRWDDPLDRGSSLAQHRLGVQRRDRDTDAALGHELLVDAVLAPREAQALLESLVDNLLQDLVVLEAHLLWVLGLLVAAVG
eukprot:GEZU01032751.1.p1 GENE.GEZU01032751.1~~GEZU01032751.1.p1  ORF type:complete len:121 (+),score=8.30 GEZU01032751.1:73-435(+)